MTRTSPHVLATRLTFDQLQETSAAAHARGLNVSEYTRGALRAACVAVLSAEGISPEGKLAAIADVLELPKGATAEQIVAAIGQLNGPDAPAPPADPLAASAEPPPAQLSMLSVAERTDIANRVSLSPAEREAFINRGMTPEQFAAAKRAVCRV